MPYGEDFYKLYESYLEEATVRRSHDYVFECFKNFAGQSKLNVVDLGCGLGEYERLGPYAGYVGVDVNDTGKIKNFVRGDYHNLGFVGRLPITPNAFVSLFSIECCNGMQEKYALYEKLFTALPSLRFALIGGFFYENRRAQETVKEAGGIVSYQTIEDPSLHISKVFGEYRIHMRTPSKLFGEDVIEVWKFLARR